MGTKSKNNDDDDISNGESNNKGNDTSLIVNVNDTQSEIDEPEESNYSESEIQESSSPKKESPSKKPASRNGTATKKSTRKPKEPKKECSKVDLSKTRYLWVSGIPDGTKTTQLEEVFSHHGKVLAIKIIRGGTDSTLLGFVKLETVEQAQKCLEKLNKTEFRGNKIELLKERPVDKDGKKTEKIGFRDRKPFISRPPPPRPHFRPPHHPPRAPFRPPMKPMRPPHRDNSSRLIDFQRQEREEFLKLERERERVKLERIKLERDKAELLKIERETRAFERDRGAGGYHDDKRGVRGSIGKRPHDESYLEEKRYDDYSGRREEFGSSRRFESRVSPDRKMGRSFAPAPRGRFDNNSRQDRYSDKYDSGSKWSASTSDWTSSDNPRWPSSSGYEPPSRSILPSTVSSSSLPRIHSSSEGFSSRGYFGGGGGGGGGSGRRY